METKKVRITFVEEVLGTASADPEIHEKYIASKAPDAKTREEEIAELGVEGEVEKTKTIFLKDEVTGEPILKMHQIKGFLKEKQKTLNRIKSWKEPGQKKATNLKLAAYKDKIDNLVFTKPRKIVLHLPDEGKITDCQRSLRAETAQGPRVALANSEAVPNGTWIEFTLLCTDDETMDYMVHCLNYGILHGIGQWRNAGKGTFFWDELDDDGNIVGGNREKWKDEIDEAMGKGTA